MSEREDVDANLAAMDDKLRELQRELSVLTVAPRPEGAAATKADAERGGEPEPLIPPEPEPVTPPEPERVSARALRVAPTPDPGRAELPLAAAAADQARTIIADAQAEAARIVGEAAQRVTDIATQIDDLQRLRDKLERSARALVDEYAAALPHVERPTAGSPEPFAPPRSDAPPSPVHPPLW